MTTVNLQSLLDSIIDVSDQLGFQLVSKNYGSFTLVPDQTAIFIRDFADHFVSVDLVRIGANGEDGENCDGGYLLPEIFSRVSHCFSPGVEYTASFESELSKVYGIKSFMADASVNSAPGQNNDFVFIKKFLGNRSHGDFITLRDWINTSLDGTERDLILQMDIEGGEYDVLTFESEVTLSRFAVIIIEFHYLENLFQKLFLQMVSSIFEKLYQNFSICHVHPNNYVGLAQYNGIDVPKVMEVTFIRNDFLREFSNERGINLPHPLDRKNSAKNDDLLMPEIWWKKT